MTLISLVAPLFPIPTLAATATSVVLTMLAMTAEAVCKWLRTVPGAWLAHPLSTAPVIALWSSASAHLTSLSLTHLIPLTPLCQDSFVLIPYTVPCKVGFSTGGNLTLRKGNARKEAWDCGG